MSVVHGTAAKDPSTSQAQDHDLRRRVLRYGGGPHPSEERLAYGHYAVNRAGPKIGQDLGRLAGLKETWE